VIQQEVDVEFRNVSIALLMVIGICFLQAQSPAPVSPTITMQAELLKTIDAGHTKAGDEVTARTVTPLEIGGEKFPVGATVVGHVTKAEPNILILVFDQIVVKKNSPVPISLSLRAVMMPHGGSPGMGERISPTAEALGGGGLLRSPQTAAQDSAVSVFDSSQHPTMAGNGGVVGLSGVKLLISSDPKIGSALQTDPNQKLKLEKGLQLMFVVSK
jgi:hypothetical protein